MLSTHLAQVFFFFFFLLEFHSKHKLTGRMGKTEKRKNTTLLPQNKQTKTRCVVLFFLSKDCNGRREFLSHEVESEIREENEGQEQVNDFF